jgi:predicted nucleotidyltransferase
MTNKRRVLLRLSPHLHDAVKARAESAHTSINTLLERYIARGLTGTSDDAAHYSEVINLAKREFGSKLIGLLLFGSQARGDVHDTSDTDILMVLDDSITIDRSLYRAWDARMPDAISLQIAHLPSTPSDAGSLWLECALDARILDDPTGRIADFLAQAKEYITSGNVVRRTTHGQGFWVPL